MSTYVYYTINKLALKKGKYVFLTWWSFLKIRIWNLLRHNQCLKDFDKFCVIMVSIEPNDVIITHEPQGASPHVLLIVSLDNIQDCQKKFTQKIDLQHYLALNWEVFRFRCR